MDKPRGKGYAWCTWLTKPLSGEERCLYRAWYKIRTKYDKIPEDPDRKAFFDEYNKRHAAILKRRAAQLRAEGWKVTTDDATDELNEGRDTAFKLTGTAADLAGKPDIVALAPEDRREALVIDAKSGNRRKSDHWQVFIYKFALPLTWLKGFAIRGEVEYHDGREPVTLDQSNPENSERFKTIMKTLTGPEQPTARPSSTECRYCDIQNCQFRYKTPEGDASSVF